MGATSPAILLELQEYFKMSIIFDMSTSHTDFERKHMRTVKKFPS